MPKIPVWYHQIYRDTTYVIPDVVLSLAQWPVPSSHKLVYGQRSFTHQGAQFALELNFSVCDCLTINMFNSRMIQFPVNSGG